MNSSAARYLSLLEVAIDLLAPLDIDPLVRGRIVAAKAEKDELLLHAMSVR